MRIRTIFIICALAFIGACISNTQDRYYFPHRSYPESIPTAKNNSERDKLKTKKTLAIKIDNFIVRNRVEELTELLTTKKNQELIREVVSDDKYTFLYFTAKRGTPEIAGLLLKYGANPDAKDKSGETPLHQSVIDGNKEFAKILLENGANPNVENDSGETPLLLAVIKRKPKVARILIAQNANPNTKDKKGFAPIHYAFSSSDMALVRYLLQNGAAINAKGKDGKTILHKAISSGKIKKAFYLIIKGADINSRDACGATPLNYAIQQNEMRLVEYLIEKKAKAYLPYCGNFNPLRRVIKIPGMGIKISGDENSIDAYRIKVIRYLIDLDVDLNARDEVGNQPMHEAVAQNNIDIIEILTSNGAEINNLNKAGQSPLHIAVCMGADDIVKYLIANGADVNLHDGDGNLALHLATMQLCEQRPYRAYKGRLSIVKLVEYLVANGSYVDAKNSKGLTTIDRI